jgi:hypothetical protein
LNGACEARPVILETFVRCFVNSDALDRIQKTPVGRKMCYRHTDGLAATPRPLH